MELGRDGVRKLGRNGVRKSGRNGVESRNVWMGRWISP
jgi:hypothetical protein